MQLISEKGQPEIAVTRQEETVYDGSCDHQPLLNSFICLLVPSNSFYDHLIDIAVYWACEGKNKSGGQHIRFSGYLFL